MPAREAGDRRGRAARGGAGLLERQEALQAIDQLLIANAEAGEHALLIAGHAGMGKTRLHEAALDLARARERLVLRAAGAELEQNLAFGVAGQLLRALLHVLGARERRPLLADAPERVRLLDGAERVEAHPDAGEDLAVSHDLFTLLASALSSRPAILAIDDLHWCDGPSLEFLLYLMHRLDEMPVALLLTRRPGGTGPDDDPRLAHIAAHPRIRLQRLRPLGIEAVSQLVASTLGPRSGPGLAEVCHEATAGNPFYLHELLLALAAEPGLSAEQLIQQARALAPDAVTRSLRVRVARLGPDAAALARAVAILGDDVPVRQAAALSGVKIAKAAAAADALASAEVLLAREPLRFVHPLVKQSIELDIPAAERSGRHLDAARLLHAEGEEPERVAAHLLRGRAEGNPWVVEQLQAAARQALARTGAQSAVRYLERAVAEPPPKELRGEVLAQLGAAEASLGSPSAIEHLRSAAAAIDDPLKRASLRLQSGHALYAQGLHEQAARTFEEGLSDLDPDPGDPRERELYDRLQTGFVATAAIVPSLQAQALERSAALPVTPPGSPLTLGQRLVLAQAALHQAFTCGHRDRVVELAEQAWDGGRLLEGEGADDVGWSLVAAAFSLAGEFERSLEVSDGAQAVAGQRGAPMALASASFSHALPELGRGDVAAALADLELARDARRYGWRKSVRAAAALYCLCLLEAGDPGRGEAALTEDAPLEPPYDLEDALRLFALAELRRGQGRHEEALDAALQAGATAERTVRFFASVPWRGSAALAALGLGDHERASQLAAEGLQRAEETGAVHLRIRALRLAGMCEGGEAGLAKLRAAVELGRSSPPRLETIHALLELGAALRRANERMAARAPLQEAADLAVRGGAAALGERARVELSATGARPRREAMLTGPGSLTPSERRIAELAVQGRSNREIAGTLFVTPKTVEYHLRNVYRKLDIRTRGELAAALEG